MSKDKIDFQPIDSAPAAGDTLDFQAIGPDAKAVTDYLKKPGVSITQAVMSGMAAAPTEGLSSRLSGALGAGLETLAGRTGMEHNGKLMPIVPGSKEELKSLSDAYEEYKQAQQKRLNEAREGAPFTYGATQIGAGLALPWSKLAGSSKLAPGASVIEKLVAGGKGAAKVGGAMGFANAPDYTNIPQTAESTAIGSAVGIPFGVAGSGIEQLMAGGAKATGGAIKSMVGPVGTRFEQGQQAYQAGEPSLATEAGLEKAKKQASAPIKDLIGTLQDKFKKAIKTAGTADELYPKYGDLPTDKVDEFHEYAVGQIQKELDKTKDETTKDELLHLLERFNVAQQGPKVPVTTRNYAPGQKPPPVGMGPQAKMPEVMPMEQPQAPAPSAPEVGQPMPEMQQIPQGAPPGNLPAVRPPGAVGPAAQFGEQQAVGMEPQGQPAGGGFKKVMATTIDKDDKEALQAFHQKVREREAEEAVLPGASDTQPIEVVPQQIEGYPDKIRLVARRRVIEEPSDEFAGQASELSQQQKESQRLRDLLQQVNGESQDEALKQQALEAAQPPFEDVTQMERQGGQNIYSPENLSSLKQDIGNKIPQAPGGAGYQTTPAQNLAKIFSGKAGEMLSQHVPEVSEANTVINATHNIFKTLGLNPDKLIQGGGVGQQEFVKDLNAVFDLLKPETNTPQSLIDQIINPEKINYIQEQLQRVDPELADKFSQTVDKQKAVLELIRDFQKPWAGWSLHSIVNAMRSFGGRAAYGAGYALENEKAGLGRIGQSVAQTPGVKQAIQLGQKVFPQFTTEALENGAKAAANDPSEASQSFSLLLSRLAKADDRTKNSMLFMLQQNVGYRKMMDKYLPMEEPGPNSKRDKELQKFK